LETERQNGEEIDGYHGPDVILEEGLPHLRGRSPVPHHVFAHTRFPDVDAELKQFAVNPWRAPQRLFPTHASDQVPSISGDCWSSRLPVSDLPGPKQTEALAMPSNHGLGLDDHQSRTPVVPNSAQPDPQNKVRGRQLRSFLRRTPEHANPMAERKILQLKGGAGSEDGLESGNERCQKGGHRLPRATSRIWSSPMV
jgi:hypothetical protein